MADDRDRALKSETTARVVERADEPPVVARLIVEIRSDGSRTIARGALEDLASGQRVQMQAEGSSPLQLAFQLAKALVAVPALARTAVKALLPGRDRRGRR